MFQLKGDVSPSNFSIRMNMAEIGRSQEGVKVKGQPIRFKDM